MDISNDDKTREALLAAIAAHQGGCFTPAQAREVGFHRSTIWRHLESGRWVEVFSGALTWAGTALEPSVRRWAGVLAVSGGRSLDPDVDGSVVVGLSHRTAATTIGTHLFDASSLVEVSLANGRLPRGRTLRLHRTADLTAEWLTTKYGPPCTTPERTLLDLAGLLPRGLVRRQMEEWLADRIVTFDSLEGVVAAHGGRGRAGVGVLRALLGDRALGSEAADSTGEAELAEVLARYGVPTPVYHLVVDDHGAVIGELDYAYPDSRVAIEMNGYGVHLRSREQWESDLSRHNALEVLGWSVLYYSSRRLQRDPRGCAAEIDGHRLARLAA